MRALPLASLLVLGAAACNDRALATGASSPPGDGAAAAGDLGGNTNGSDGGSSAVDLATDLASSCTVQDLPSKQAVRLHLINPSTSQRLVATQGRFCDAFSVGAPRSLGFQCICECPAPPPPSVIQYLVVGAGEEKIVTWDARVLTTCDEKIDCAARGFPNQPPANELVGASVPAPPGGYTVTFAVEDKLPPGCSYVSGSVECSPQPGPPGPTGPIQQLCPSSAPATASFTLPPAGDVDVKVVLK